MVHVDVDSAFRDVTFPLATEETTIFYLLAPQHHSDNTDLEHDKDK